VSACMILCVRVCVCVCVKYGINNYCTITLKSIVRCYHVASCSSNISSKY